MGGPASNWPNSLSRWLEHGRKHRHPVSAASCPAFGGGAQPAVEFVRIQQAIPARRDETSARAPGGGGGGDAKRSRRCQPWLPTPPNRVSGTGQGLPTSRSRTLLSWLAGVGREGEGEGKGEMTFPAEVLLGAEHANSRSHRPPSLSPQSVGCMM